jgi:hypothetical protein
VCPDSIFDEVAVIEPLRQPGWIVKAVGGASVLDTGYSWGSWENELPVVCGFPKLGIYGKAAKLFW